MLHKHTPLHRRGSEFTQLCGRGYANFTGEGLRQLHGRGLRQLHGRGVWGREVPPWGMGTECPHK